MENEKIIQGLEKTIEILERDLKTYGAKNERVAAYDLQQIAKYKNMIKKLKENK